MWYAKTIKGTGAEHDFELFSGLFLEKFRGVDPECRKDAFQYRRQGITETVSQYAADMEILLDGSVLDEPSKVVFFIRGLRENLQRLVDAKEPESVDQAEKLALEYETQVSVMTQSALGSSLTGAIEELKTAHKESLSQAVRELHAAAVTLVQPTVTEDYINMQSRVPYGNQQQDYRGDYYEQYRGEEDFYPPTYQPHPPRGNWRHGNGRPGSRRGTFQRRDNRDYGSYTGQDYGYGPSREGRNGQRRPWNRRQVSPSRQGNQQRPLNA